LFPGLDRVSDSIPLHEVERISALHGENAKTDKGVVKSASMRDLASSTPLRISDNDNSEYGFLVQTIEHGRNSGRAYAMRADSAQEYQKWLTGLNKAVADAKHREKRKLDQGFLARERRKAREIYQSDPVQYIVGIFILASYAQAILGAQLLPTPGSSNDDIFKNLELIFTIIFSVELAVNLFGHWWVLFVKDWWNWLDSLVVAICIISTVVPNLPALNVLRLLRVFKARLVLGNLALLTSQYLSSDSKSLAAVLHLNLKSQTPTPKPQTPDPSEKCAWSTGPCTGTS
jgi:hypothetical protein